MQCFQCSNQIVNVYKCPIYYVPKRMEIKTMSLCKTKYTFRQPIAESEIESNMTILPEEIHYLDKCDSIAKDGQFVFCNLDCVDRFVDDYWMHYILSKSKPILWRIRNAQLCNQEQQTFAFNL